MSLLGNNTLNKKVEISKDVKLRNTAERIKQLVKQCHNNIVNAQRDGIDIMWGNKDLTPQEIIDELGVDVIKVFHFHHKLTQFIKDISEFDGAVTELKYPTNNISIDSSNGKVTVTNEPYKP
jgi:hypothetical protein